MINIHIFAMQVSSRRAQKSFKYVNKYICFFKINVQRECIKVVPLGTETEVLSKITNFGQAYKFNKHLINLFYKPIIINNLILSSIIYNVFPTALVL